VHVLPKNASNAPLLPLIVDLIITFVATPRAAISDILRKAAINSQLSQLERSGVCSGVY
jgi:hypothetical protein